MSKLNASAFEFVPGKFTLPPQVYQQQVQKKSDNLPEDASRAYPEQSVPAKTPQPQPILSTPPANDHPTQEPALSAPSQVSSLKPSKPAAELTAKPSTSNSKSASPAPSKAFSLEKSKTNTTAVAEEVRAVADESVLQDLYGSVKEHLNIVFVGHVDAGKSTMGGNLLFLTGAVDQRTMEKLARDAKEVGRESWYLSWALDSTPQERNKGKTVEVGRAYFETSDRRYTILDAPGHKTYVPSMIQGAAQADIAILVISARKGEFETGFEKGGQTREHIMLVKTTGVSKLVIAINKMDDTTVQWNQDRYNEVKDKITPFIKAAGYNPKTDVSFIPVSAYTGTNLKERVSKSVCSWWDGPSFLEYMDTMPMVDRKFGAPLMMPISEKYKDMGTIVVGKIESGHLKKGDSLLLMPIKILVDVATIYNEIEDEITSGLCGDNVRIRLRGVDDEDISPGFVLTSPLKPIHSVRQFEAQLAILEHKNIICAGYSAILHVHASTEEVILLALLHYFDKATGRKSRKPPQFAKRGQKIVALIEASAPICVERFQDYPQLGRFTLRDEGRTIAIGKVTKLIEGPLEEIAENLANTTI